MTAIPDIRAGALRLPTLGRLRSPAFALAGMAILMGLWWLGGKTVENDPDMFAFADFAPAPTLAALWDIIASGEVWEMSIPSLWRVGYGMAIAAAIGIPVGIAIGRLAPLRELTNVPFQFLRMISPLSWMPIAVMAYDTWDGAIVFLIMVAAIWPILFSTAAGVRRIDPSWLKVARNLGANPFHMLFVVILPAIAVDILTGVRLALGVAWVVLVPAEYLGVTSGLGYAINDARDTLDYARLAAVVVIIGAIGFTLDWLCMTAIKKFNWVRETAH